MRVCYGKVLKTARKAKKMTQEQIAEMLNVSPATYQAWEASLYRADEYALLKLEEILDNNGLALRYMQEASPIVKKYSEPMFAAIAVKEIYQKLEPLIPHVTVFLDTMSQIAY